MSPSSRTLSTRAKVKSSSPKVDGEPFESNSFDEGETEVAVVVEAEMTSTRQDLFARGARLLDPV